MISIAHKIKDAALFGLLTGALPRVVAGFVTLPLAHRISDGDVMGMVLVLGALNFVWTAAAKLWWDSARAWVLRLYWRMYMRVATVMALLASNKAFAAAMGGGGGYVAAETIAPLARIGLSAPAGAGALVGMLIYVMRMDLGYTKTALHRVGNAAASLALGWVCGDFMGPALHAVASAHAGVPLNKWLAVVLVALVVAVFWSVLVDRMISKRK